MKFFKTSPKDRPSQSNEQLSSSEDSLRIVEGGFARLDAAGNIIQNLAINPDNFLILKD